METDLFNTLALSFAGATIIALLIGGNLKRKNIFLRKSSFILKALSFLPAGLIAYIITTENSGYFSGKEYLSSFVSVLFSIFLFGMADFLEEKSPN